MLYNIERKIVCISVFDIAQIIVYFHLHVATMDKYMVILSNLDLVVVCIQPANQCTDTWFIGENMVYH